MEFYKDTKKYVYKDLLKQLPMEAFDILSNVKNVGVAIQIKNQGYIYWNQNLLNLYNIPSLKHVMYKRDDYITENKKLISLYSSLYDYVMESNKSIPVTEVVEPRNRQGFRKLMTGKIYPLSLDEDRSNAVLSLIIPENKLLSLSPEGILNLSNSELNSLLNRIKYEVIVNNLKYSFSKREILCFIALFKGLHAGKMALEMNIKQTTVESYIKNLKNKCGVSLKSDLIAFFIENHILQKIVV